MLVSVVAQAEDAPPTTPPPSPTTNPLADPASLFGTSGQAGATAGLGFGQLDGNFWVQMRTTFDLNLGDIGLGLQVPLNLLAYTTSATPTRDDLTYFHIIRKADWPKPSSSNYQQYLQLVRYVRYGHKRDPLYALVGQIYGSSMGHGTIIDRTNNSLNPLHPKYGLDFEVNAATGGIEFFTNSLAWPGTNVVGARAYARPTVIAGGAGSLLDTWAVGASIVTDRNAPLTLATSGLDKNGSPCSGSCLATGDDGLPIAATETAMRVFGVDTELQLLHNAVLDFIPYVDFNREVGAGNGLHAGIQTNFTFPILATVNLWTKLEYRLMQPAYIPGYFDAAYELQRYTFPIIPDLSVPKAAAGVALRARNGTGLVPGVYGEATFQFLGMADIGATYTATPGIRNSSTVMAFATLPKFDTVKVTAYYLRKNFEGLSDVAGLDERSMLVGALLYKIFGPVYLMAAFQRHWATDPITGKIVGTNDYNFGLQSYFPL